MVKWFVFLCFLLGAFLFSPIPSLAQEDAPFVLNFKDQEIELNPFKSQSSTEAQLFLAFYEGLVTYDPFSLSPVPGAAEKWSFSPDSKEMTFKLREGLKFSDGTPLTASDFVETWFITLDPQTKAPFSSLFDGIQGAQDWREGKLKDRSQVGFHAVDEQTLVITLVEEAPQILSILCHHSFAPLHPQMRENPVSDIQHVNGPYQLQKKEQGRWFLEKNLWYWDTDRVKLKTIEMTFTDDSATSVKLFQEGHYDWLAGEMDKDRISNVIPVFNRLFGTSFFYFRVTNKPWNDERVRQAMILLLPLKKLRDLYHQQQTEVLVPPLHGYPQPESSLKQDKSEGLRLLAEAGFPSGKGLPSISIAFPKHELPLYEMIKKEWQETLSIDIQGYAISENYSHIPQIPHDLGYYGWIGDFVDPMAFLILWKKDNILNISGFNDQKYEALLQKAALQQEEKRLKTLSKAESLLLDKGLIIPLGHSLSVHLIDLSRVGGWYPNYLDLHPFKTLYRKPPKPLKNVVKFDANTTNRLR